MGFVRGVALAIAVLLFLHVLIGKQMESNVQLEVGAAKALSFLILCTGNVSGTFDV